MVGAGVTPMMVPARGSSTGAAVRAGLGVAVAAGAAGAGVGVGVGAGVLSVSWAPWAVTVWVCA